MTERLMLIFGKSYTGKTARMLHEVADERRVVLVDAKCEQLARLTAWSHLWPEYNPKAEAWSTVEIVRFFAAALNDPFRVVVHFRAYHRENFELLCYLLERVKQLTLAVDELGLFLPPGAASTLPPNTTSVLISGSHKGIKFVGTAQSPSFVHINARRNASRVLIYRITEDYDLDSLRLYLNEELRARVEALPNYVCVDWQDGRPAFVDASLEGKLANVLPAERA